MNEESQKKSLQKIILEKIRSGKAKMRPKWHFVLKAALIVAGLIIVTLALLYLVSFVLFVLRQTGVWFLPAFGLRGIGTFLISLPWLLVLVGIVFIILLEALVRHYSFAYRKPLLYSLLGIIIFVTVASIVVARTSFHEGLFMRARMEKLPVAGQLYRDFGMPKNKDAHIGTITEITNDGFRIETPRGETLTIIVTSETRFPSGIDFQKDDRVVVLGQRDDGTVKALGIRRIDEMMEQHSLRNRGWYRPIIPPLSQ